VAWGKTSDGQYSRGPQARSPRGARLPVMEVRTFDAPSGERLDVAIAQALAVSRTFAKELVSEGYVTLDGKPVGKPATKLSGNEVVSVLLPPARPVDVEPEDLDVPVLFEDEYLAVIDKPPGIVAHPTATVRTGTVVNALLGRIPLSKERFQDPADDLFRPGIVHRLDKDTSGVMVVAKTDEAHRHLANSFKRRFTEKEYVAIAVGEVADGTIVDAPIGRHPVERQRMTVGGEAPRSASTHVWALARAPGHTLVRAKPHTGRTHQIRVHLWHLGAPILGDEVYGKASSLIGRQALHARSLTLPHPRDNAPVTFVAPVREDIVEAWLRLGGSWPSELELPLSRPVEGPPPGMEPPPDRGD
jgi:23S rRNA pseudouridine1911/1915/1917 synthase